MRAETLRARARRAAMEVCGIREECKEELRARRVERVEEKLRG